MLRKIYSHLMRCDPRGFTMLEVICVLLVIGIISAIAVTRFSSTSVYSAASEAEILKNYLRYAQFRALSDGDTTFGSNPATWGISFAGDGKSYTLLRNGSEAPSNLPNESSKTHSLPGDISITSGAGTTVTYDVWGSPGGSDIDISIGDGSSPPQGIHIGKETGFIP